MVRCDYCGEKQEYPADMPDTFTTKAGKTYDRWLYCEDCTEGRKADGSVCDLCGGEFLRIFCDACVISISEDLPAAPAEPEPAPVCDDCEKQGVKLYNHAGPRLCWECSLTEWRKGREYHPDTPALGEPWWAAR